MDSVNKTLSTNMLLCTSYALNVSNTKRVAAGLEYIKDTKEFQPRVLISSAQQRKKLNFDRAGWEDFKKYFDLFDAYFRDEYRFKADYADIRKFVMAGYNVTLTTAYKYKAVLIEKKIDDDTLDQVDHPYFSLPSTQPLICMQQVTFEGIKATVKCVDEHMEVLSNCVEKINQTLAWINDYLQGKLNEKEEKTGEAELAKTYNFQAFCQFYALESDSINMFINEKMFGMSETIRNVVNFALLEISAFGLYIVYINLKNNSN